MSWHAEDYKAAGFKVLDWAKAHSTITAAVAGFIVGVIIGRIL